MNTTALARVTSPTSPALMYLARLAPRSRQVQAQALRTVGQLLGAPAHGETLADVGLWSGLDAARCAALAARLRAEYAPATANRILSAIRGVVRESWRLGYLDADTRDRICDIAPARARRLAAGRQLSDEEVALLFARASARDSALLALMIGGGLRREEAATRCVEDLQGVCTCYSRGSGIARGQGVTPLRGVTPDPRDLTCRTPMAHALSVRVVGKGDRERICYIAGATADRVLAWLDVRGRTPGRILGIRHGGGVWSALSRLRTRAGVAPFTPHDLRRTYASRALAAGVDLVTVQAALGHADPRTTSRYDRRGADAQLRAALHLAR